MTTLREIVSGLLVVVFGSLVIVAAILWFMERI